MRLTHTVYRYLTQLFQFLGLFDFQTKWGTSSLGGRSRSSPPPAGDVPGVGGLLPPPGAGGHTKQSLGLPSL